MKKILHVINNLHNGGIEKFILSVNKEIKDDLGFDYAILTSSNHFKKNSKSINDYGGCIYDEFPNKYLNKKLKNIYLFFYIKKVLSSNKYSGVHIHDCMGLSVVLLASYVARVPIRIVHSHNAYSSKFNYQTLSIKGRILSEINKACSKLFATHLYGCSQSACERLFGPNIIEDPRCHVIYNGIDLNVFSKKKEKFIKQQNAEIYFCNIGRYCEQKNQLFLIDVFSHLQKEIPCHLTLVGFGDLEIQIREKIKNLSLENYVTMLPHSASIPNILKKTNYFILPSIYEGLGIVLIEAQAMGLKCFISDAIPDEAQLGLCKIISLELEAKEWAEQIMNNIKNEKNLKLNKEKLKNYDIKIVSRKLLEVYSK